MDIGMILDRWELIAGLAGVLWGLIKVLGHPKWLIRKVDELLEWTDIHDIDLTEYIEEATTFKNLTNVERRQWVAKKLRLMAERNGIQLSQALSELIVDSAYRTYKRTCAK